MNTRMIMTATSLILGTTGIALTFGPDLILAQLGQETTPIAMIMAQVIGGLYFGYAMLNWMHRGNLIGGIYNRPVAVANFTHFMIAGLAIIKKMGSASSAQAAIWVVGITYAVLGILFIIILFRHPVGEK